MKKSILKTFLYIVGILLICYPLCARFIEYKNQTKSVYNYKKEIAIMEEKELENRLEKAEKINNEKSTDILIVKENEIGNEIVSEHDFLKEGEIFGYIRIPKLNIELPIYEGTTIDNLEKGVTHMENTSLPNGMTGTHCVLAGHTGILRAEIFDNIDKLEIGDEFFVNFLGNNNRYTIINKEIVWPDDTKDLKIEQDKCLVTLVTCTPRSINSHRLLVTAKLDNIEENNTDKNIEDTIIANENIEEKSNLDILQAYLKNNIFKIVIIAAIIILIIMLEILSNRKKGEKYEK